MPQLPEKSLIGTKKDPHRIVALNVSGFVPAFVQDAMMEVMTIEGQTSLGLVEMLIAERARAHGIEIPETQGEARRRLAEEMRERQAQREKLA